MFIIIFFTFFFYICSGLSKRLIKYNSSESRLLALRGIQPSVRRFRLGVTPHGKLSLNSMWVKPIVGEKKLRPITQSRAAEKLQGFNGIRGVSIHRGTFQCNVRSSRSRVFVSKPFGNLHRLAISYRYTCTGWVGCGCAARCL